MHIKFLEFLLEVRTCIEIQRLSYIAKEVPDS